MDDQERERRYKIIKEARESVERLDRTAHDGGASRARTM
jgi:hypothetical protein